MPAPNLSGVNGPRPGRTHGRLRNTLRNVASKSSNSPYEDILRPQILRRGENDKGPETLELRSPGQQPETVQALKQLQERFRPGQPQAQNLGLGSLGQGALASLTFAQSISRLLETVTQGSQAYQASRTGDPGVRPTPGRYGAIQGQVSTSAAKQYGWSSAIQQDALQRLIMAESGYNPTAQNPTSTAFGIFQFLDSTWSTVGYRKSSDPTTQIAAGLKYIQQRYGTPANAWAFHQKHGWY